MRLPVLVTLALVAACGAPLPPLAAGDVEITRPVPGRQMSAGYLSLTNNTDQAIRITGVSSPQYRVVEIHETRIEDGVSRMRALPEIIVPARSTVALERGGKHLMLMGALDSGEKVSLVLTSDGAPVLTINYMFPVETG